MSIDSLNQLGRDELVDALNACCHCRVWAEQVADSAPFESREALLKLADECWRDKGEREILEAFSGHPQIGDMQALRNKYATTASAEQGQVAAADEAVLVRLRDLNRIYLDRFGFIFIVCASGKRAEEMLALLEDRVNNTREQELANGAAEQGKITELRLIKLLEGETA